MKDVAARIKEQSTASKKVVNSADLFATSVAAEIRKISERMRCMVKNKMNKVFKHQTMMRNPIQMLTPSPENSFQIFNQQPSFQVQKPHSQMSNHQVFHHLIHQALFTVQEKLTMTYTAQHINMYI